VPGARGFLQSALLEAGRAGRAGAPVSQAREAMTATVSETGGRSARFLVRGLRALLCVLAYTLSISALDKNNLSTPNFILFASLLC